jgi:hypothetical protein
MTCGDEEETKRREIAKEEKKKSKEINSHPATEVADRRCIPELECCD